MEQLHKGLSDHGTTYFAYEQSQGKGQRNKQWHTQPGANIILSVILNTSSLQVSQQFALSMATAIAAYNFFKIYALENVGIKWPNDLFWCDRKAGGILIENIIRGECWQWAVAGIGININQTTFDASIKKPVSLKQITGKTYDPVKLAKELCEHLEKSYYQLLNNEAEKLLKEYNDALYKRGKKIKLKKGAQVFEAIVKGVNANGQLIVESDDKKTLNVGEIKWII